MKSKAQIKVVLDSNDEAILVVYRDKYAHNYEDLEQLASDLILLMDGDRCQHWDNNQWDTGITSHDATCGEYWGTPYQVIDSIICNAIYDNDIGDSHAKLAKYLQKKLK